MVNKILNERLWDCARHVSSKELDEAALAVGVIMMFLEGSLVKQLEAEGTREVVRMELLSPGRYKLASDGLLTPGTKGATPGVVVDLAVRLTIVVVIVTTRKCHSTYLQREQPGKNPIAMGCGSY